MPQVDTVTPYGEAIRKCRERQGLSLPDLAARIGRHPQSLRHLELGSRKASVVLINQIANALGVDPGAITKEVSA